MNKDTVWMLHQLERAGISMDDAYRLRRISMTLHRWHELECGDDNGHMSYTVARGHKSNGSFEHDDDGKAYLECHPYNGKTYYTPIADRERGALKRLGKIMDKYQHLGLSAYVQGDPRGASLYILRQGDVPEGQDTDAYYSRGIAVYK